MRSQQRYRRSSVTISILVDYLGTAARSTRSVSAVAAQLCTECARMFRYALVCRTTYLHSHPLLPCLSTYNRNPQPTLIRYRRSPKLKPCLSRNNATLTQSGQIPRFTRIIALPKLSEFPQTPHTSTTREACFSRATWGTLDSELQQRVTTV